MKKELKFEDHKEKDEVKSEEHKTENESKFDNSKVEKEPSEHDVEVAAAVSLPKEGGWGWVVVFASFLTMFIQTGIILTFGAIRPDIQKTFKTSTAATAAINSVQTALYFLTSPFAAAFINRYGFRACGMLGSVISCLSLLLSALSPTYELVLFFNGFINGIGYSFVGMASLLVLGFYFEKRRVFAIAMATNGYSLGPMVMFPLNSYLVKRSGWRNLTIFQAGCSALIYFLSLTYKPLVILTVTKEEEQPRGRSRSFIQSKELAEESKETGNKAKIRGVVPITKLPTIDKASESSQPSQGQKDQIEIEPNVKNSVDQKQLKEIRTSIGAISPTGKTRISIVQVSPRELKTRRFLHNWCWCCHWEKHHKEARPLYRDDAFYHSSVRVKAKDSEHNSFHRRLTKTRFTTVEELKEEPSLCSKATKRVLVSMLSISNILKIPSFRVFCASGFFCYLGMFVPYLFVTDKNKNSGLVNDYFVTIMSVATVIGKFALSSIATRIDPVVVYGAGLTIGGISTMLSSLSYTLWYQYLYCVIYGAALSVVATLRVVAMVNLYGLNNLTNATGMLYLFLGVGSLIGPPLTGLLETNFDYTIAFFVAGFNVAVSGVLILGIACFSKTLKKVNGQNKAAQG